MHGRLCDFLVPCCVKATLGSQKDTQREEKGFHRPAAAHIAVVSASTSPGHGRSPILPRSFQGFLQAASGYAPSLHRCGLRWRPLMVRRRRPPPTSYLLMTLGESLKHLSHGTRSGRKTQFPDST